jgi:hypothetical protein
MIALDNECNWITGDLRTTDLKCEVLNLYLVYVLEVLFYPVILLIQGNSYVPLENPTVI